MKLTLNEIINITDGNPNGSFDVVITGCAGIEDAKSSDVSFIGNPKYVSKIESSSAGLVFITQDIKTNKPALVVKNPQLAFAKILDILSKDIVPCYKPGIHKSAVISETAKISSNVHIGPFVVIEGNVDIAQGVVIVANTFIGANTKIGASSFVYPNVTIRENTAIGSRAIIHSGVVIGSDGFGFIGAVQHKKIPQLGNVEIGDDVEIGANTTIDRATVGSTKIGDGTKIDNMVQIAHNVHIGKNCIIVSQVGIAGSTKIGDYVTIAGQAGLAGHINIGDKTVIAARSAVIGDIAANQIVSGYPARPHREAMKLEAVIRKLPQMFELLKELSKDK